MPARGMLLLKKSNISPKAAGQKFPNFNIHEKFSKQELFLKKKRNLKKEFRKEI